MRLLPADRFQQTLFALFLIFFAATWHQSALSAIRHDAACADAGGDGSAGVRFQSLRHQPT